MFGIADLRNSGPESLSEVTSLLVPHLQNKVQQYDKIKTTEMAGNGNTREAKPMRVSQHRMPDYKNVL